jgi:hypothetical protein
VFRLKRVIRTSGRLLKPALELLLTLLILTPCARVQGNSGTATLLPLGFQLQMETTPKAATVGDPIRIDLDIELPEGGKAELSGIDKQIGEISVLEFFPGPAIPESGPISNRSLNPPAPAPGLPHHRARVVAAIYKTGTYTFPPIQIRLRTADGKQAVASTPSVKIEIQSVLSEKDRNPRDLKKQAEIPEPVRWGLWGVILLAIAALAILSWALWKRRRKRTPVVPAIPPRDLMDIAEQELRQLLAGGFPESGRMKHFYVLLSEIVKKILEAGYGVHTAERTTSEIVDSLRFRHGQWPEQAEGIESFLLRCDIVKFAKYVPSKAEHESTAEDALRILERARQQVAAKASGHSPLPQPMEIN